MVFPCPLRPRSDHLKLPLSCPSDHHLYHHHLSGFETADSLQAIKLGCHSFMDAGRRPKIPGSEIKGFTFHSIASSRAWCRPLFPCLLSPTGMRGLGGAAHIENTTQTALHWGNLLLLWWVVSKLAFYLMGDKIAHCNTTLRNGLVKSNQGLVFLTHSAMMSRDTQHYIGWPLPTPTALFYFPLNT